MKLGTEFLPLYRMPSSTAPPYTHYTKRVYMVRWHHKMASQCASACADVRRGSGWGRAGGEGETAIAFNKIEKQSRGYMYTHVYLCNMYIYIHTHIYVSTYVNIYYIHLLILSKHMHVYVHLKEHPLSHFHVCVCVCVWLLCAQEWWRRAAARIRKRRRRPMPLLVSWTEVPCNEYIWHMYIYIYIYTSIYMYIYI